MIALLYALLVPTPGLAAVIDINVGSKIERQSVKLNSRDTIVFHATTDNVQLIQVSKGSCEYLEGGFQSETLNKGMTFMHTFTEGVYFYADAEGCKDGVTGAVEVLKVENPYLKEYPMIPIVKKQEQLENVTSATISNSVIQKTLMSILLLVLLL